MSPLDAKNVNAPLARDIGTTIVIVTGLPRSGTSLMMQMLVEGGLEILSDSKRVADEDNPNGYFEFEKAKFLKTDASWVEKAKGKGVKVVAQLLPYLPPDFEYRLIFMHRPMDEVLRSQKRMLVRNGAEVSSTDDARLGRAFETQLERIQSWVEQQKWPAIHVEFENTVYRPEGIASLVNSFLGSILDEKAMSLVSDSELHRNRSQ